MVDIPRPRGTRRRGLSPGPPAWASLSSYRRRIWSTAAERWFYADGIASSASEAVVVQFISVYAILLGATDAEIGLLAIASGLAGVLALVPGAALAERAASRKWTVLVGGGGIARLAILGMAVAPLFLGEARATVYALVGLTFLKAFAAAACHPSWVSLLAEILPIERRAFCVSQRMLSLTVTAAVTAPLAGLAIRWIGGVAGVQVLFLAAFLFGAVSTYCYWRIPERRAAPAERRHAGSTVAVLRDAAFVQFLSATFVLHTSAMLMGPFIVAYLVRHLQAQPAQVGVLVTVEAAAAVLGQFALGFVVVRVPATRLFRWVLFTMPAVAALWLVPRVWWQAALPNALGGMTWAAHNVLSFNLLMEHAPPGNLPRYAAAQQAVILAASFLGPAAGIWIVGAWDIRTAMVVSAAGRLIAALVLVLPVAAPAPRSASTLGG